MQKHSERDQSNTAFMEKVQTRETPAVVVDEVDEEVEVATHHQETAEERPEQPPAHAHHVRAVLYMTSDYPGWLQTCTRRKKDSKQAIVHMRIISSKASAKR